MSEGRGHSLVYTCLECQIVCKFITVLVKELISLSKLLHTNSVELNNRIHSPGLALTFSENEIEIARKERKLLSLDIELTKACNLSCLYCYAASEENQKDELGLSEIIRVIDEAKELGLRTLNLTGGEPLLDKKYFTIAKYAYECNISVLLFTNGTLITEEIAQELMELRISPCVKLDSLSSSVQDYLADKNGVLESIKKGINNLIMVGYTTKYPVLSVNAVVCRHTLDEIPELWAWARRQNIVPSVTRLQLMGRAKERADLMVTPEELRELYSKVSQIDKEFGIVWEPTIPWPYGQACIRHYIGCFIDSQGNVQPCSGIPIKAGNVRERSLKEILSGADIFKVARNMENHVEGACKICQYRSECYGCRSISYFMAGSFTAADPLCWHSHREKVRTKI